jgi:hypothetical protein
MTTTGITTSCSSNRDIATGSASKTLVSRTYVRNGTDFEGAELAGVFFTGTEISSVSPRAPGAGP